MVELKENKVKETFIKEIVQDINDIPIVYLRTLYALIHTFKENILIVENIELQQNAKNKKNQTDDFDWDNLIDEIHRNRQQNNEKMNLRVNNLFVE